MTGAGSGVAHAQDSAQTVAQVSGVAFFIPAQPLPAAIEAFIRASRWQVGYSTRISDGIQSRPVTGTMPPAQALRMLLAGTGINVRFTGSNTATLMSSSADNINAREGEVVLDTITVTAENDRNASIGSGYQGTPDWVYQAPAAVSVVSREAIQNSAARNVRDLLDSVSGVYANRSEAQNPGIAVNIRGLQDQDRIATMIDGARQNFQRSSHGATQRTYVDTAFLRQIDVEKSTTSGVGSAGALGGSVNFRTVTADDLIEPGKRFGGELNVTTGTNKYFFDGSTTAAFRFNDSFSFLAGVSNKHIGAYEIGKNGSLLGARTTYDGNVLLFSGQKVFSSIMKAELKPIDDMKLTFGWIRNDSKYASGNYSNTFATSTLMKANEGVVNDTYNAALDWSPGTDLIDLKAKLYFNHLKNNRVQEGAFITSGPSNFVFTTLGGSVENTSRFTTPIGSLALNYGAEAFKDEGKTTLSQGFITQNGADLSASLSGGTPSGGRDVVSGFGNATLKPFEWVSITGGIRYDWYRIGGTTTIYGNETADVIGQIMTNPGRAAGCNARGCWPYIPPTYAPIFGPSYYPAYDVNVDRSGGAWLPSLTLAFQPFDWLQPFVKYSKSYRPPTIMESFLNGGHDANVVNGYAPNPFLKPERGDTYEIGANISRNGIFTANDSVRFKTVGFYREITDYISFGYILNSTANRQYDSYVNLNGPTRMKGFEIEANYDARIFYIGGTVTRIDTELADNFTSPAGRSMPINSGRGATVIFEQPRRRVTLDLGVRLFDEKLTLGTRVTDVSETEPALGSLRSGYEMPGYRVYDIYGSYAFNEKTKLRFAVNNVADLSYAPGVGSNFYAAPGRTATFSLNVKF